MLSKQAFNGLLKTLEEPPSHLKFIFATTEIKKIPVTIISRCQRFDLHRVSIKNLVDNLKRISKIESGKISEGALTLIAKAAQGSVRDSLSLLDRALVTQNIDNKEINEDFVRKMLGIADRSKILNLLNFIFEGDDKKSLHLLRELVSEGLEPVNFLNDLLEIIYFIQQRKSLGSFDSELSISEIEQNTISEISRNINMSTLVIFWQLTLKVLEELSIVSNPILSIEMLVIRLVHLKEIPSYESLIDNLQNNNTNINISKQKKIINDENQTNKISKNQIKNMIQTKPVLSTKEKDLKKDNIETILSLEDLIKIASKKKEVQLKYDLENNVNLIKFSQGKIDISFNQNLDKDFVRNLSENLLDWTGNRWVITLSQKEGQKTFSEMKNVKKKELFEQEKKGEIYKKFKDIFSDGELLEIKEEE